MFIDRLVRKEDRISVFPQLWFPLLAVASIDLRAVNLAASEYRHKQLYLHCHSSGHLLLLVRVFSSLFCYCHKLAFQDGLRERRRQVGEPYAAKSCHSRQGK